MNEFHSSSNTSTKSKIRICLTVILIFLLVILAVYVDDYKPTSAQTVINSLTIINKNSSPINSDTMWHAPSLNDIPKGKEGDLILYGRDLIVRTSYYLGPKGIVSQKTNGMNCQNCHLDAGTKPFGNNYSAVASTYPKFRYRSGKIETIEKRVEDCFERSLNGISPTQQSKEMKAIVAYINWVGTGVPKGVTPRGAGLLDVKFLTRAADSSNGKLVYKMKCKTCHLENGEGQKDSLGVLLYPPLWGDHSFNNGAGLFRLTRMAGFVKANMPFGAGYATTQLSDEEVWDVVAYINSLPRPKMDVSKDWPDESKKPIDNPFGPYTDHFTEQDHKYGPFAPIKAVHAGAK